MRSLGFIYLQKQFVCSNRSIALARAPPISYLLHTGCSGAVFIAKIYGQCCWLVRYLHKRTVNLEILSSPRAVSTSRARSYVTGQHKATIFEALSLCFVIKGVLNPPFFGNFIRNCFKGKWQYILCLKMLLIVGDELQC